MKITYSNSDYKQGAYDNYLLKQETQRLLQKYATESYNAEYKTVKILALCSSMIFNLLSAATASLAVYYFIHEMLNHYYGTLAITGVLLLILELSKRKIGHVFFKHCFQKNITAIIDGIIFLALMALSIMLSYNGGKKSVHDFIPPPVIEDAAKKTASFNKEIARIDQQIEDARNTKYKGLTTLTSQRSIETLEAKREVRQEKVFQIEEVVREGNKKLLEQHTISTQDKGLLFAKITVFAEFLFLCCLVFMEYYDNRSYKELTYVNPTSDVPNFHSNWSMQELQSYVQKMIDTEIGQKIEALQTAQQNALPEEKPQSIPKDEKEKPPTLPNPDDSDLPEIPILETHPVEEEIAIETSTSTLERTEEFIKKEIRNLRNRMNKARSRIKKGEGNLETHQATVGKMEAAIHSKNKVLRALKNGQRSS